MDIRSAVKKSLEEKCGIRRSGMIRGVIVPIHERNPFYVFTGENNGSRVPNWNPTPEDLLADDWEVTKV